MGAEEEIDAPRGLERAHVQVAAKVADRVDPDLVAERLEQIEIGMGATRNAARIAEELAGERKRSPPLPDPARSVEEIGVRRTLLQGGAEKGLRLVLLRKGLERVHG
jgi:hypothetical protein